MKTRKCRVPGHVGHSDCIPDIQPQHTPTPWKYEDETGRLEKKSGQRVGEIDALIDGEFIVRAVNLHSLLTEQLKFEHRLAHKGFLKTCAVCNLIAKAEVRE